MTTRRMKKRFAALSCTAVLLAISLLFSFGKPLGLPSWQDIYAAFGFTDVNPESGELSVHFLNVGCADSVYINCGDYNVLIDAGNESLQNKPAAYLRENGVKKLDLVIATHPDKDHIGGMQEVAGTFPVERFWIPQVKEKLVPDSGFYTGMLWNLEKQETEITHPWAGEYLRLGDMVFTVLSPSKIYSDTNNSSIVVRLSFGKNSFLFTGDAEKKAESDMLKSGMGLKSDVLKVGHHGSKSSSTKDFLKAVSPRYAVISVGDNSYGLPKKTVIKRLEKLGTEVYRTDRYGTVVFYSDGERLTIHTQRS